MKKERRDYFEQLAREHGIDRTDRPSTSLLFIDHDEIRRNFRRFREALPRVQPYFAVKANALPEIVQTLFNEGASFDVASLAEFCMVYGLIEHLPAEERQEFIWENIIYAHPIIDEFTLHTLNQYQPLVTYDNLAEIGKIREHAPKAGLLLRIWCQNTGSVVDLSCKFGVEKTRAVDYIAKAIDLGLNVEGLSFHVGSQCMNHDNYTQAFQIAYEIFSEAEGRHLPVGHLKRGSRRRIVDMGGGFPVCYESQPGNFDFLAKLINEQTDRIFPENGDFELIAEPGRFMVATAGTLVARVIGVGDSLDGQPKFYVNDGVYHTFSGQVFDHIHYPVHAFNGGKKHISRVFGHTCDGFDEISQAAELPKIRIGDLVYAENIGAYSNGSSTNFNGFPPAKIVHLNL